MGRNIDECIMAGAERFEAHWGQFFNAQTGDFRADDNIQTDYFTPCAYAQGKKTLLVTFVDRAKRIETHSRQFFADFDWSA